MGSRKLDEEGRPMRSLLVRLDQRTITHDANHGQAGVGIGEGSTETGYSAFRILGSVDPGVPEAATRPRESRAAKNGRTLRRQS
jgi:hypothetical protein